MAFSVAWLLSSFLPSSTISVCAGIVAPIAVAFGLWGVHYLCDMSVPDWLVPLCYITTCLVVSSICFTIGTWVFLRRVEP